jgi:hypothetical protein
MRKAEVRALAEEAGLLPAHKRSSRGICFVGQRRSFGEFMRQYAHPVGAVHTSMSPVHTLINNLATVVVHAVLVVVCTCQCSLEACG